LVNKERIQNWTVKSFANRFSLEEQSNIMAGLSGESRSCLESNVQRNNTYTQVEEGERL